MIKRRNGAIPRKTLQARRKQDVSDEFERPLTPIVTPFEAKNCTIQPYVGDTFQLAPDGFQGKDVFTVFTETLLTRGKEGSLIKPDELLINNVWFRVVKVKPWQVGLIPHYECIVVELDEGLV